VLWMLVGLLSAAYCSKEGARYFGDYGARPRTETMSHSYSSCQAGTMLGEEPDNVVVAIAGSFF